MVESAGFQVRRLDTPSSTAHYVWQASSLLTGQAILPQSRHYVVSALTSFASVAFWAIEYGLTLLGHSCGEELLVIAEKPHPSASEPSR
jgi:hypothetical protein